MTHPSESTTQTAPECFRRRLEARLAAAPFDARLGCELVHVSTSAAVDALVARFKDLDEDSQAAVLAKLDKAG